MFNRETIRWYIFGTQEEGSIFFFEIRALNSFWAHLQMMFNFPEIVSRDHEGELYVIISLDISVWEGDTASMQAGASIHFSDLG